jgi:hypothetical protein
MAIEEFKEAYDLPIDYSPTLELLLSRVNHIVILTALDEFIKNEESIKKKNVFDYRYIYCKLNLPTTLSRLHLLILEIFPSIMKILISVVSS